MVVGHGDHEMQLQVRFAQVGPALDEAARFGEVGGDHAAAFAPVAQDLAQYAHTAAQRIADQVEVEDLLVQDDVEMVLQVLADAGQVLHHRNPQRAQMRRRAHARSHQQLRRTERPRRHDHLAPRAQRLGAAAAVHRHARRALAFEDDAQRLRAGQHRQQAPSAVERGVGSVAAMQIGARGIPALPVELRDLVEPNPFLLGAVEIVVAAVARGHRRLHETLRDRVAGARVAHMQRAVAAVQRIVIAARDTLVAFRSLEVRQHGVPAPAGAAERGPVVVVVPVAAGVDHRVER